MLVTIIKSKQVPQRNNEQGWPKSYKCNFLEPGAVSYEDVGQGMAFLKKETMDTWIQSFKGKPVIIEHQDIDPKNFKSKAVGYITQVWYEPADGWYWLEFLITDDEGHEAIKDGYSVSCSFDVLETLPGSEWHAIKYDEEITKGDGQHLALVTSPRYEDCRIVVNSKKARINADIKIERIGGQYWVTQDGKKSAGPFDDIYDAEQELKKWQNSKSNQTDFKLMSPIMLDKYMQGLSDVGLQTIIDGEHEDEIKKIAKMHQGDREKKKEEEVVQQEHEHKQQVELKTKNDDMKVTISIDSEDLEKQEKGEQVDLNPFAAMTNVELEGKLKQIPTQMAIELEKRKAKGEYITTNKKEDSKMFKLWGKKSDKASIKDNKIDASKVLIDVDGDKVPLSTLMNSFQNQELEVLSEADEVMVNGKKVSIKTLINSYKSNDDKKKDDGKDEEEKKDDKKCDDDKKDDDKKEKKDDKKCDKCGKKLDDAKEEEEKKDDSKDEEEKKEDKKEKKDDATIDPKVPNIQKKSDDKKEDGKDEEDKEIKNSKSFFMDLENAKLDAPVLNGFGSSDTFTREDRATKGKKFFGSKKK